MIVMSLLLLLLFYLPINMISSSRLRLAHTDADRFGGIYLFVVKGGATTGRDVAAMENDEYDHISHQQRRPVQISAKCHLKLELFKWLLDSTTTEDNPSHTHGYKRNAGVHLMHLTKRRTPFYFQVNPHNVNVYVLGILFTEK